MRIGFVSQYFTPERGAAALPGVIAAALARRGHDVRVLTAFPNYPDSRVYDGYRQGWRFTEQLQGATVHRAPHYLSHDDRAARRIATYTTFAATSTLQAVSHLRGVDAVWVHSSPATVALPAMALKAATGIPYVLHIQDIWPETVTASGFVAPRTAHALERGIHPFTDAAYRGAASVQVSAPGMRRSVIARGIDAAKVAFLPNWCDESAFHPVPAPAGLREELGAREPFTAMYAGAMGEVQGLDVVLDAADALRDLPEIGFVLVGTGVARPHLEERVAREGLEHVHFAAPQPFERMADVLASADAQLIVLKDLPVYRLTLPSKTQATMAAGRPMIVSAAGDVADVVTTYDTGLACEPGSGAALAAAVREAYEAGPQRRRTWGDNGRRAYLEHFSEDRGIAAIEAALQDAAATADGALPARLRSRLRALTRRP